MKFNLVDWYGCRRHFEEMGYKDREEYEGDPFEKAKEFFERGLAVMIYPYKGKVNLCVSTRRFSQYG